MKNARKLLFVLAAITLLICLPAWSANPTPIIYAPIVPDAVAPGSPSFVLTVNGTGFVSGATINWNGKPQTTAMVSGSQLTATIPATEVAAPGAAWITVSNPSPGGGRSNSLQFEISSPVSTPTFTTYVQNTGEPLTQMVAGDFNGDGKVDLVGISAITDGNVSVLLGVGDGSFTNPKTFSLGSRDQLVGLWTGDFNNDGVPDVAVAIQAQGIDVLLGHGDGTFKIPQSTSISDRDTDYGVAAVVADVNGDSKLDLAIGCSTTIPLLYCANPIAVYLGNGDGTFNLDATYLTNTKVTALALGDFNRDNKLDLIYSVLASANFFLGGNGDGTFQAPLSAFNSGLSNPTVADFNGDGKLDLIAGDYTMPGGFVVLGNGDGTFGSGFTYPSSSAPFPSVTVTADFNADGKLDLGTLLGNSVTKNTSAAILLGNGDGTFQTPLNFLSSGTYQLVSPVAVDLNRDGRMDLVMVDPLPGSPDLIVLMQRSPGSDSLGLSIALGNSGSATVVAGQATSYNLTIGGQGLAGTATLTCSGLPTGATCSVPGTIGVDGESAAGFTARISTTSRTIAQRRSNHFAYWAFFYALGFVGIPVARRISLKASVLLLLLIVCGCGGGNSAPPNSGPTTNPNGTPEGTYTITVTGAMGSQTQTASLTLVVQ